MSKPVQLILNAVNTVLLTAVVILAVLLAGVRLVGLTPYTVLSGSMEPAYPVGSLIYVRKAAPESIRVGDAITFVLNEDLAVATHRVVEIDEENRCFRTKGDANNTVDGAPVFFENLIGKPVFTVPYLGYFSSWILHPPGMYLALTATAVFIIVLFLPDALKKAEEADKRKEETRI